jgi:predicted RNA-binding protein with PUA-like domain
MKCEPEDLTIDQLKENGKDAWDGVRNPEVIECYFYKKTQLTHFEGS